jgi:hypothetical protein
MSAISKIYLNTADEFLNSLRLSNDSWHQGTSRWVFRGVGDADNWTLLPHAWRPIGEGNKLTPLIETIHALNLDMDGEETDNFRKLFEWEAAEKEALNQFAMHTNNSGFRVSSAALSPNESPIKIGSIHTWTNNTSFPNTETVSLAQHHGIPTRLLDWTRNPITAAYFSASPLFRPKDSKAIAVWALDATKIVNDDGTPKKFSQTQCLLHEPNRGENKFLHAQNGVLTELKNTYEFFKQNDRWPSLEEVFSVDTNVVTEPILKGHFLKSDHVPRLLKLLDRDGVTLSQLMPTMDNVAREVASKWST